MEFPRQPDERASGAQVAVRSSRFCAIWRCEPRGNPTECRGEKTFLMHSIGYQMAGGWLFHGTQRPVVVETATVIAGSPGQSYGCRHPINACESVCAISLLPGALDEGDAPIFDAQVLTGLTVPGLKRFLAAEDDEQFESFVFDIFDGVSRASLRGGSAVRRIDLRTQRVKRFIELHAFENISLADIAASVGVSPFTCIRQFKIAAGVTPLRYLTQVRIERAQVLLKNQRLTMREVANQVGIRDRYYFTRWFSKAVGMPPQAFREHLAR
jgi:AraC-like DNA-binding protein